MGLLEDEYQKRVQAIDARKDPDLVGLTYIWYLREKWRDDGTAGIFEPLQHWPKARGLTNLTDYVKGELTDRQLFDLMLSETIEPYVSGLISAGIVSGDFLRDPEYVDMIQEVRLEGVKACRPLSGMWTPGPGECVVALEAATIWLRFIDQLHGMLELPLVQDLRGKVMRPMSEPEAALLESNDFTAYALTDREREDLKRDLGLPTAVTPTPRIVRR